MKIKDGFMLREMAGSWIVVAVGDMSKEFHGMITLNGVGSFIWKLLANDTTKEHILSAMLEKYDVTEQQASSDLNSFIDKVRGAGILEE